MLGEHAAHDIFIDVEAKGVRYLLRDAHAAEFWITSLHFDDGCNEFGRGTFGTGLAWTARGREEQTVLSLNQRPMEFE